MTPKWSFRSGAEIEEAYVKQRPLSDLLPTCPAIYVWRRSLEVPDHARRDSQAFVEWLNKAMQVPVGEVRDQRLSHFAVLRQLTLQSQGLTETKKRQFTALVSTPKKRRWLAHYVRQLGQFSPPPYCGETGNILQRTRDHLSGETGFGQHVRCKHVPSWSELELAYYSLEKVQPKDERHAREFARTTKADTITRCS